MHRNYRLPAALSVCLLIAATGIGTAAAAAPARRPATCDPGACAGQDPVQTGCTDDARALDIKQRSGRTVSLLWSPNCQVTWGQLAGGQVDSQGNNDSVMVQDDQVPAHSFSSPVLVNGLTVQTLMINSTGVDSQACATLINDPVPLCTEFR
ncbi:DUF2690 domain-containing protein [Streptomyces sp. NPDC052396]|uniref:DUF2690 domain-containing protein n=1 Tax=Streptomyces sp. NPDC052396 TaxID=3365689 RepID=UPI0037CE556E